MKLRTNAVLIVLVLLTLFDGLHRASAFYDPGTQRWLNRDPIGEFGGISLFTFVYNKQINLVDLYGLVQTGADINGGAVVYDPITGKPIAIYNQPANGMGGGLPGNNPVATFPIGSGGQYCISYNLPTFPAPPNYSTPPPIPNPPIIPPIPCSICVINAPRVS